MLKKIVDSLKKFGGWLIVIIVGLFFLLDIINPFINLGLKFYDSSNSKITEAVMIEVEDYGKKLNEIAAGTKTIDRKLYEIHREKEKMILKINNSKMRKSEKRLLIYDEIYESRIKYSLINDFTDLMEILSFYKSGRDEYNLEFLQIADTKLEKENQFISHNTRFWIQKQIQLVMKAINGIKGGYITEHELNELVDRSYEIEKKLYESLAQDINSLGN